MGKTIFGSKVVLYFLTLLLVSSLFVSSISAQDGINADPDVDTRVKDTMEVDGKTFRDLNGNGELDPYEDWRLPVEERVEDLVSQMNAEEKAGLMHISSLRDESSTGLTDDHLRYFVVRDDPNAYDLAERGNEFQELAESTRLGIPVVMTANPRDHINFDQVVGHAEASGQWPGELGLAATQDPELVREFAELSAEQWRSSGMHKMYGYMADVLTEPRWTRTDGTFGEDPELIADMMTSIVEGFQGEELSENSVSLTTKHFPGGGPRVDGTDPHHEWGQTNEYPTEGSLYNYHLPPMVAAIEAGTTSIMPYYAKPMNEASALQLPEHLWFSEDQQFEEVAFAYNKSILQDLMQDELGFDGYVNSDSGILDNMPWGVEHLTLEERYAKAIDAGTSIFSDYNDPSGLISALDQGVVSEDDLDPSVTFLLTEMFELGLFENPYVDPELAQEINDDPETQDLADEAHRKSIVLLSNENDDNGQVLPITDNEVEDVKLYVEAFRAGEEESAEASADLAQSIASADPSMEVVDYPEEATHAYIAVMPTINWRQHDNEGDPPSIELKKDSDTEIDAERILDLQEQVETTILGVNMTNPWLINEIEPGADAVLATFNNTPESIVDIIRGKFNPTGELPFTVPADTEAVENNASDVPGYAETFDYAYTDASDNDYELGFGLSYTSASDIKEKIDQFEEEGEFQNFGAARSLQAQLNPVEQFENQGDAEKVVQHLEGFNQKLEQHIEKGRISEKAFESIQASAADLMAKWQ
ncbi:beta-glucosidase [Virgibacillus natechei]|uniref:beta-glucosidase n=2 Tax=Virgibacillus natechei TaxID=1216297 RepID=A0ABS4ICC5_9BACI|nr:beta-glucosidase [Virgibacillus natechei]